MLVLVLTLFGAPTPATAQNNLAPATGDHSHCPPASWFDVKCYGAFGDGDHDDTDAIATAINDAINNGIPLHFPGGAYKVTSKLTWDYAPIACCGLQIISEHAVIDGSSITSGNVLQIKCSGGMPANPARCYFFSIKGTLQIVSSQSDGTRENYAVDIGDTNFDDQHYDMRIDDLVAVSYTRGIKTAGGVRVNFVTGSDLHLFGDLDGGDSGHAAIAVEQLQSSRLSGLAEAYGSVAPALLFEHGASIGNMIAGFTYLAGNPCLSIANTISQNNVFMSPVFTDCTTATAGPGITVNTFIAPTY